MDSDEDDFITIGTPLEPLGDNEIPAKKPFRDEGVRDEKGRYRFHGAFTGGFSAGYFNTVGSVEGWEPASFVSSRGKKAENVQQNPEDFMDAEDFGQFGIAPRKIKVTAEFERSSSDKGRKRGPYFKEGPIPGEPPLKDIVRPIGQSIGLKILQQMGWRPGQGIGPRIKMNVKKNSVKSYGCSLPPNENNSEDDDPLAAGFTFAPDDIQTLPYTPKDNLHGIGYSGLSRSKVLSAPLNIFDPTATRAMMDKGKKKLAISGQAFGVGAFEDDDDDIYAKEDMSQYDFLGDDFSSQDLKASGSKQFLSEASHLVKTLEGFHLATKLPPKKKDYPPPPLPPNFRPVHIPFNFHVVQPPSESRFLDRHKMTGFERNLILEPKQITEKSSVFDLLSSENRAHLEEIKKQTIQKQSTSSSDSTQMLQTLSQYPKSLLKPFINDESKQKRYEQYLVLLKEGKKELFEQLQPSNMTEWEKKREQGEFDRASVLYKPLSSSLNSRFVSSAFLENDNKIEVRVDKEVDESEKAKAADMKMFGQLTREKYEWHPSALLCKRFNVPMPYADSFVGLPKVKRDKFSIFNFLSTPTESDLKHQHNVHVEDKQGENKSSSENLKSPEENIHEVQDISNEEETYRPPMDLFKAIFQDSTSDSSDSEDKKDSDVEDNPDSSSIKKSIAHADSQTSQIISQPLSNSEKIIRKPATGVFANIDLDALNKRPPKSDTTLTTEIIQSETFSQEQKSKDESTKSTEIKEVAGTSTELYGPSLPPGFSPITSVYRTNNKDDVKRNKSKREKHKHKHKKHKSKKSKHKSKMSHKHTKRKSSKQKESASEEKNASSSDSEVCDVDILQKIKELQKLKKM